MTERPIQEGDIIKRDLTSRDSATVISLENGIYVQWNEHSHSTKSGKEMWEGSFIILAQINGL